MFIGVCLKSKKPLFLSTFPIGASLDQVFGVERNYSVWSGEFQVLSFLIGVTGVLSRLACDLCITRNSFSKEF